MRGAFPPPLSGVSDAKVIPLVKRDAPLKRTGSDARSSVQKVRPDKTARGSREPSRAARDEVLFPDRYDVRVSQRGAASNDVSKYAVAISRCEDTSSESFKGQGQKIDLEFIGQIETTKMGTGSSPTPIDEYFWELDISDFYSVDRAMKG